MKIMVPVAGMIVAAGSCCCCGMDMEELMREIENASGSGAPTIDVAEGDDAADAADEAAPPSGGITGGVTAGLCGRYQSDGLSLPSGFNVIGCTVSSGTESLLAMGGASPKDTCSGVKSWATDKGWAIEYDVEAAGTYSITLKKGADRMSLACSDAAGQTSVAVTITPG